MSIYNLPSLIKACALTSALCSLSFGQFWQSATDGSGKQFIYPYSGGSYYNVRAISPSGWSKAGDTGVLQLGAWNNTVKATYGKGISVNPCNVPNAIFAQEFTGNVGIGTSTPASKIEVNGSISYKFKHINTNGSSNYMVQPNDNVLLFDGGGNKIQLPPAAGAKGRVYTVKAAAAAAIPLVPSAGEKIEGASDILVIGDGRLTPATPRKPSCQVMSDGATWWIISFSGVIYYDGRL